MNDLNLVGLADVDDAEDPRIAEAADQVVDGLRALEEALGPAVLAMLADAIGDRLDDLCEEMEEAAEAEEDAADDDLLDEDDGQPPQAKG